MVSLLGGEGVDWSTDKDLMFTERALLESKYNFKRGFGLSDRAIFATYWQLLDQLKVRLFSCLTNPRLGAWLTNDPRLHQKALLRLKPFVRVWAYANKSQAECLEECGIDTSRLYYHPFYVPERVFRPLSENREELLSMAGLKRSQIRSNQIVIGSFQRDSLGSDLNVAKHQKGADQLIESLSYIDRGEFVLLLAGPRRHYIVNQCRQRGYNYIFVGDESLIDYGKDDLSVNNLDPEMLNILYNLCDYYVVSSRSEGGPKAIFESILTETTVLSTNVGVAKDWLEDDLIYSEVGPGLARTLSQVSVGNHTKLKSELRLKYLDVNSWEGFKSRTLNIIESLRG